MIPVVSLNSCLCLHLLLFMKTPNVNAMSESESWNCNQLCSGFFAFCAVDCCVDLLEKAKKTLQFLQDLTLSSKDKNLVQWYPKLV